VSDVRTLEVEASGGSYGVHVGPGAADRLPELAREHAAAGRIAVISDSHVGPLHAERLSERCRGAGLDVTTLTFPAGESSKRREVWARLTDRMLDQGLGRDSCVVAVGGGVTTDLAGFVAATYLRGIPVIQVPTSYLAMIDASVGGKTGVDTAAGKNLVGAFHAPAAVLADTALLRTLSERQRREGLVEAAKHGAILDETHLDALRERMEALLSAEPRAAADVVLASVGLKARVVSEDEFESGYRQILNFGHTVGHAVEAASSYAVGHGTAVAIGMLAEARIGERVGVTREGTEQRLADVLRPLLGFSGIDVDAARAEAYLPIDKKSRGGAARYVLLERVGVTAEGDGWVHEVPASVARAALRGILGEVQRLRGRTAEGDRL